MGFAYVGPGGLAALRMRKDFAGACVPPWRPDLRPEMPVPRDAGPTFVQVLRGLFGVPRGPAHRGPKPELAGR